MYFGAARQYLFAMAQATYLQAVSQEELDELCEEPTSINQLDKPDSVTTYFAPSINYFVTGSAYPTDHDLAPMLMGEDSVDCSTLENGSFDFVTPDTVRAIAELLADVDLGDVRAKVEKADLEELVDEEELYDLEVLDSADAPETIAAELGKLQAFYEQAAEAGMAVVMYTT